MYIFKALCILAIILFSEYGKPENENLVEPFEKTNVTGNPNKIEITIIYDDNPLNPMLKNRWGFSCFIQGLEKTILFDTGGDGGILISNMYKLGIDPKDVDVIFLSHDRWSHTGGLQDFLALNQKVVVYLLKTFSEDIKNNINNLGAEIVEITSSAYLCEGVVSTGELGNGIKEQSLVLEIEKGSVIITGCAHPGIVDIIQNVKESLDQNIYMVFGGFHLVAASDAELKQIIEQFRKFGVEKVGPCHCSGERCRELFLDEYKEDFVDIGVGSVIQIE